jgi:hypothetical protein
VYDSALGGHALRTHGGIAESQTPSTSPDQKIDPGHRVAGFRRLPSLGSGEFGEQRLHSKNRR